MAYIGKTPVIGNFVKLDSITVVNGQAAYTMQNGGVNFTSYDNVNQFLVSLNGVLQAPTDSFTVSGSTLTFASNLSTGDVIDFVLVLGNSLDIGTPSDNTVTGAKLSQPFNYNSGNLYLDNTNSRVGIGTTAPDSPLDILTSGNSGLEVNAGTSSTHRIYLGNTGGTSAVGTLSNHDFAFISNGSERMRIRSGGGLAIGGTGDANTLDDYEEGTWTPTFQASGNHYTSVTYALRLGTYTKIGRMVIASFRIQLSAIDTTNGTGGIQIESLPFTSLNTTNLTQTGAIDFVNNVDINAGSFGTLHLSIGLDPNNTKSRILRTRNNAFTDLIPASSATNSTDLAGVLIYAVN